MGANELSQGLKRAANAAESGDLAAAEATYSAILSEFPTNEEAGLGLAAACLARDEPEQTIRVAKTVLAHNPKSARAFSIIGQALQSVDSQELSVSAYAQAIQIEPRLFDAQFNVGIAFRLLGMAQEAVERFHFALGLRPDTPEVYYHLGNALYDTGDAEGAFDAYKKAIELKPDYREAHTILNKLYWEHGHSEPFLQSYRESLKRAPRATGLYEDYAQYLTSTGQLDEAETLLGDAEMKLGAQAPLCRVSARIAAERGDWAAAMERFDQAISLAPNDISCLQDFARVLIMQEDYEKAAAMVAKVDELSPLDQQNIAYGWLCKRFLGDLAAERLYDFERFVRCFDIACPPGYTDIAAFNRDLAEYLKQEHRTTNQPLDQSLRMGTQTHGLLFDLKDPRIKAVENAIKEAVATYISDLPEDPAHILLGRKSNGFHFSGSWSVLLRPGGHHINHVHSQGWVSSAYYVEVPDDLDHDDHEGWLKFGETDMRLGEREIIGRIERPVAGRLCLFPSYMYHGTVPLKSGKPRMTIAFDVVPD